MAGQGTGAGSPGAQDIRAALERRRRARRRSATFEKGIVAALFLCALVSVATTAGIVGTLVAGAVDFFGDVPLWEFLTSTQWTPMHRDGQFGILPLLWGTVMVSGIAAALALPVGLATAIYLSEYASPGVRSALKPALEVLAGIPTVVYGFFALVFVNQVVIRWVFPEANVFNALGAGLVMGVMIVPMVSSLSEDAMVAVPRSLREAAYGLGATRLEVALRVVTPAALSGIVASFLLAISRALGETMIVAMAAGATPNLTFNPLESIQTMTAYIVQVSLGDTPTGSIEFKSIFAVAMTMFIFTLSINVLGTWIVGRYRERY